MHNSSAMMALGELKKNDKSLSKQQKKVGTGMKIVGAGDGASEYAISEKMRLNIRALDQATTNVRTGKNMLMLASKAIDEQVSLMQQVAVRTMQASDDTYTDKDRTTLNKEISQLLDQTDDIATQTTYNGIHLLDQVRSTQHTVPWFNADAPFHENPKPTIALTVLNNSAGAYTPVQERYLDITLGSLYDISSAVVGTDYTYVPDIGTAVWNKTTGSLDSVAFTYTNNVGLIFNKSKGSIVATSSSTNIASVSFTKAYTSVPGVGTSVACVDPSTGVARLGTIKTEPGTGLTKFAFVDSDTSISDIDFSTLFQTTTNPPAGLDGVGFTLRCDECDQYVAIEFDAKTTTSHLYVGERSTKDPKPMCYIIGVGDVKTPKDLEQAVFDGIVSAGAMNPEYSGSTGSLSGLSRSSDGTAHIAAKHHIDLNYYASTGKFTISKHNWPTYEVSPTMTLMNGVIGAMDTDTVSLKTPEQLLKIQSSNKGSQDTAVIVPNTTLSILFPGANDGWGIEPEDGDYPTTYSSDYSNCQSEAERRQKWREEEWKYPARFVEFDKDHTVDTREKASAFLGNVHQAIKYLLYSNTTLGSEANRMDYTASNLVNTTENLTASDSTIRDADMAKEMMNYTKSNILAQSAQAMLAQANQNSSGVLGLLQ